LATTDLIKELLEAGVHFGHQTKRWNPKMKRFIFGERGGIYIIDLEKSLEHLNRALDFLRQLASSGGNLLFVGTKKQAREIVKEEALRCGQPYVNDRWLGGMLTNFVTIRKSVERLRQLEKMQQDGIFDSLTKKESAGLQKEMAKLKRYLGGVLAMDKLPKAVFLVDSKEEDIAVKEANRLKLPIVALVDTNCDPDQIDYPIPGNDDAMRSIKLITSMVANAVLEGQKSFADDQAQEAKDAAEAAALPILEVQEELIETSDEKIERKGKKIQAKSLVTGKRKKV